MRFPGARKFAAVAVPFALAAGTLVFTAAPAQAIRNCTTNQVLLAEAQAAENDGDGWVDAEEFLIDEGDYEDANIAYIKAGIAFKQADVLYAEACAWRQWLLAEHPADVGLDDGFDQVEAFGDLGVGQARADFDEDLAFLAVRSFTSGGSAVPGAAPGSGRSGRKVSGSRRVLSYATGFDD